MNIQKKIELIKDNLSPSSKNKIKENKVDNINEK